MTKQEAYKEWMAAANNHCYCSEDVWNAACDWQKAQDIKTITYYAFESTLNDMVKQLRNN